MAARRTPYMLIVRDGWGENPNAAHDPFNAVKLARTPIDETLRATWPSTLIHTSGEAVGVPEGTVGNSEVGHQNLGAGRIVDQDSVRISKACREDKLSQIAALRDPIERARDAGKAVHVMGLASDAGVHALLGHLYGVLDLCDQLGAPRVYVHAFTDGRDSGPYEGVKYVEQIQNHCDKLGYTAAGNAREGGIASVIGRYWAMDRDNRWERVAWAYRCLTGRGSAAHDGHTASDALQAIRSYYDTPLPFGHSTLEGDEFTPPTCIGPSDEAIKRSRIADGDTVIFYNYRGDRPRELASAFVLPNFQSSEHVKPSPDTGAQGFDRGDKLDITFVGMTAYAQFLVPYMRVAFAKPPKMEQIAGQFFAEHSLTQFRCAETEKYPHVTFFFNDYRDEPFPGERRENPQSPRVATYDIAPEMSAAQVRDAVLDRLDAADGEDVLIVNFANPDMVGHTGKLDAAIKACETVDACVGTLVDRVLALGGGAIVTADHGNAEQMWDLAHDCPHTSHTLYDVPLFVIGEKWKNRSLRPDGKLADVMPTLIDMMGLDKPAQMTGTSLLI